MFNNESKKVTSIFDAMVDGVYVIDEDYNLEYMNDIMCKDFGQGVGLSHPTTCLAAAIAACATSLANMPTQRMELLMLQRGDDCSHLLVRKFKIGYL